MVISAGTAPSGECRRAAPGARADHGYDLPVNPVSDALLLSEETIAEGVTVTVDHVPTAVVTGGVA